MALAADQAAHVLAFLHGGAFAGIPLLLAALGIYGVTASWVNQRRQEIGIRLALVASGGDVVQLALMHGARLAVALTLRRVAAKRLVRRNVFSIR